MSETMRSLEEIDRRPRRTGSGRTGEHAPHAGHHLHRTERTPIAVRRDVAAASASTSGTPTPTGTSTNLSSTGPTFANVHIHDNDGSIRPTSYHRGREDRFRSRPGAHGGIPVTAMSSRPEGSRAPPLQARLKKFLGPRCAGRTSGTRTCRPRNVPLSRRSAGRRTRSPVLSFSALRWRPCRAALADTPGYC